MAHDLLLGKTTRDWSCGKSAAELWDETESQRLHRPVHLMAPKHHMTRKGLNVPEISEDLDKSKTSWNWIFGVGGAVLGLTYLTIKRRPQSTRS